MAGQKAYSLRDKLAGKKPSDVRVPESEEVVKGRLSMMTASRKKKRSK